VTRPATRISLAGLHVQRMTTGQDLVIVTRMALCQAHKANAAVSMLVVILPKIR